MKDMLGREELITVGEALQLLFHYSPFKRPAEVCIPIENSYGMVLSKDILAPEDLPAFSRSTMDGFAVRSSDSFGATEGLPAYLTIVAEISMGEKPEVVLQKGEGAKIATGGMLPAGADAVVMLEYTQQLDRKMIEIVKPVSPGENVIQAGEDARKDEQVLKGGHRLRPQDVGALAGLRASDKEETIELTSPYNTLIRTNLPTFSWIPKKEYDKFIVNLYNSKGLVWSKKIDKSPLILSENEKGLDFGETYFWNVEGEDLLDNEKSSNYRFSVLSVEKFKEVINQEDLIRKTFYNDPDSSSLHSFLGAYFMNQGLLQDAINEFQIVSRINPDASLPHEILGSLFSDAGNKDRAIEELQKALALSKDKDK